MTVSLPSVDDPDSAVQLVRAAHQMCPYSRATSGNIDVRFTVNGRAVDQASEAAIG
jgi:osmotically inducible protein OsmC